MDVQSDSFCFQVRSRSIGYGVFGSRTGYPIIYFHGLPGSRHEASLWHSSAIQANICLIALDRPGIGLSAPQPQRSLKDYLVDVSLLISHLQVDQFSILGVSGGSMYALLCALHKDKLPGLQKVGIVAGLGPRSLPQRGSSLAQQLRYRAMDWTPTWAVRWLWDFMIGKTARQSDSSLLRSKIQAALTSLTGPEAELCKDERIIDGFVASIRGAFAQSSDGYVKDATIASQPWGFDLEMLAGISVGLWYGEKDDIAPAAMGREMAKRIPGAVLKEFSEAGHIATLLCFQSEILQALQPA